MLNFKRNGSNQAKSAPEMF